MNLRGTAMIGLALCAIAAAARAVMVDARDPRIWLGLAALFALALVLLWRRGAPAARAASVAEAAETTTHRNATVYIGGGGGRAEAVIAGLDAARDENHRASGNAAP